MEMMLGAQKIIIDTDPGQDDAVAILLALASPDEIEVLGITQWRVTYHFFNRKKCSNCM